MGMARLVRVYVTRCTIRIMRCGSRMVQRVRSADKPYREVQNP